MALSGLAIEPMTAHGAHGLLQTFLPPPGAPLAATGSFVRVFFAYSPQSAPGSAMVIAVNGRALRTVDLGEGNAAGGVLEVPVPTSLIDLGHPNRLQVTFDLAAGTASQDLLYGRVNSQTLIHYELAALPTGIPGLETYPWSLLATDASSAAVPSIGIALPAPPDMAEAAAALRIAAELGRRASTQRVRLRVIPPSQLSAPDTQGAGVLLVGRLDHLPAAQRVLVAAGWHPAAEGWMAPDGRVASADEGLLVTAVSPWDGRTPVVLASGATNAALAKAAAALVEPQAAPLAGAHAIATAAPGAAATSPRSLELTGPDGADLAQAAGRTYEASQSFVAPELAQDRSADLRVIVPALAGTGKASVAVNGTEVATAGIDKGRATTLRATVPARLLRQGRNSLSVSIQSDHAGVPSGADAMTASIRFPTAPDGGPDLAALPFPFIDGAQRGVRFLLSDVSTATLTAAAQAAVALGQRSTAPPGRFETGLLVDPSALAGTSNLVVVGAPDAVSELAGLTRGLAPPPAGSGEVAVTRSGERTVLWLLGGGDALLRATAALYSPELRGQVGTVDVAGKLTVERPAASGGGRQTPQASRPVGRGVFVVAILILAAAAMLVSFAVVQLLHARRVAG